MSFLLSMLPLYLMGNFHCLGMCGPLVLLIGSHPYRSLYFLGRTLALTFLGLIAATFGMALEIGFKKSGIPAALCFILGTFLLLWGFAPFLLTAFALPKSLSIKLAKASSFLSSLLLRNHPLSTFYFGFFTPLLPCGQLLLIFSLIALNGDPLIGLISGSVFALLTSPSLIFAMKAFLFMQPQAKRLSFLFRLSTLPAALLAFLRGFADLGYIEHASITLPYQLHFVLY